MAKTSMNLDENVAGALCYIFGFITGILFFVMEKKNKFVRFHAMQSIIFSIGVVIVLGIFQIISWFLWFLWVLTALIWLLIFIVWIVLMFKAYQGEKFKLPIIGDIAEQQVK